MSKEQKKIQSSMKTSPGSSTNSEREDDVMKKSNGGSRKSFGESDDDNIENMSGFDSDSEEDNSKSTGNNCKTIEIKFSIF